MPYDPYREKKVTVRYQKLTSLFIIYIGILSLSWFFLHIIVAFMIRDTYNFMNGFSIFRLLFGVITMSIGLTLNSLIDDEFDQPFIQG